MQIHNINEYMKTQEAHSGKVVLQGGETVEKSAASDFLREINIDSSNYHKNGLSDATEFGALRDGGSGEYDTAQLMKNEMVLNASNLSDKDLDEMDSEGYNAKELDYRDFTNIADKIKLQLAKAGVDIEAMGGLSSEQIESITGNAGYATVMENAINAADLPLDDELINDGVTALTMADGIREKAADGLSRDAMKYLLVNSLEPTISNMYQAVYSTGATKNSEENAAIPEEIEDAVKKLLTSVGSEVNDKALNNAAWMLENDIPITGENVNYLNLLEKFKYDFSKEDIIDAAVLSVEEGKSMKDGYLIEGYSLLDQAKAALDVIDLVNDDDVDSVVASGEDVTIQNLANAHVAANNHTKSLQEIMGRPDTYYASQTTVTITVEVQLRQVTARKQLEEIRLSMTLEASYTMLKNGIDVSTTELSDLVDELRKMQESLMGQLIGENEDVADRSLFDARAAFLDQVLETTASMQDMPALLLGRIPNIKEASFSSIYQSSTTLMSDDGVKKILASERYETMMTEVRGDLGDSIKKAFKNSTEDILNGLELENSESNARAVRILGYNSLEITRESVLEMREVDALVQKTFKSLTPATVTEMIREGFNPLDATMEEITKKAEEIQANDETKAVAERFSKYLLKMDQMKGMTEEERESFLGIYRLMHQVTETDGAAIGMLLEQGTKVTMRNLMTAVRTGKHENRDYTISDDTEYVGGFSKERLSITDQIEMAFETGRMEDAIEAASPDKFKEIGEDSYMEMSPDQLAAALENTDEDEEIKEATLAARRAELQQAASAEAEVYVALDRFDIPVTIANLQAMQAYYSDRNVFKNILKPHTNNDGSVVDINDINIDALIEESLEDYGEAIKTPEEMAEAEHRLEEIAENIMRNDLLESGNASIDLKAMQLRNQMFGIFAGMAKQETYHVPIMVADEYGNMSLKIVRGVEDKGLVDIAYSNSIVGKIQASFRYENGNVAGTVTTDSRATQEILSENAGILADRINEEAEVSVSFSFAFSGSVDLNEIYADAMADFATTTEQEPVKTRTLYSIARSFVQGLSELS